MRTDIRRIKVRDLKAGMTVAFANPNWDYLVDHVSDTKFGEIKIEHGDFTATDFLSATDFVWVLSK